MQAADHGLCIAGVAKDEATQILLLAPQGADFWRIFTGAPEYHDGAPDPMDRWSHRVITALAASWGGDAHFPFGGPPYAPFHKWALASGQAWSSPVGMLVHARMGLMLSFRGAIALPLNAALPPEACATVTPTIPPCADCAAPCTTACPVDALGPQGYDVAACHAFLDTKQGANCLNGGCLARCACPLSQSCGRLSKQSAWHMRQFHP